MHKKYFTGSYCNNKSDNSNRTSKKIWKPFWIWFLRLILRLEVLDRLSIKRIPASRQEIQILPQHHRLGLRYLLRLKDNARTKKILTIEGREFNQFSKLRQQAEYFTIGVFSQVSSIDKLKWSFTTNTQLYFECEVNWHKTAQRFSLVRLLYQLPILLPLLFLDLWAKIRKQTKVVHHKEQENNTIDLWLNYSLKMHISIDASRKILKYKNWGARVTPYKSVRYCSFLFCCFFDQKREKWAITVGKITRHW